jgi:hypothetical protein
MQMTVNDRDLELLSQWLDGELNEVDSHRLRQRIAAEVELREAWEAMTDLNSTLREALVARAAVPAAISDRLAADPQLVGDGKVVTFPGRNATAPKAPRTRRWPAAIAASLTAAVAIALVSQQPSQSPTGLPGNDALVSASLDTLTSASGWSELEDGRQLQPVLSFAHRDGTWCREYLLRSDESDWRAVACREDGRWVTQAAGLESYLDSTNAYRPAGAADSAPVSVFISEYAAGVALGRDGEQALITGGWQ